MAVKGDASFASNVAIAKDLSVKGNASVDGTLAVKGDASFASNVVIAKDLTVKGDTSIDGKLAVKGDASFASNVVIAKDLTVAGNTSIAKDLSVNGNASVDGTLTVKGDALFASNVTVNKDLTVHGKLFVEGRDQDVKHSLNKIELATNVGASALLNIVALELTPESLRKEGIAFNSSIGSNDGGSEVRLGVSKTDSNGVTASIGIGTESGTVGVSIGKNVDVTENIKLGFGVSADGSGLKAGPSVAFHKDGYGVGVSSFGPTVMINGVSLPIAGPMALPNLVLTGTVGAYKAITGKTKAEIESLKLRAEKAEAGYAEVKMEMDMLKAQVAAILAAQKSK